MAITMADFAFVLVLLRSFRPGKNLNASEILRDVERGNAMTTKSGAF